MVPLDPSHFDGGPAICSRLFDRSRELIFLTASWLPKISSESWRCRDGVRSAMRPEQISPQARMGARRPSSGLPARPAVRLVRDLRPLPTTLCLGCGLLTAGQYALPAARSSTVEVNHPANRASPW